MKPSRCSGLPRSNPGSAENFLALDLAALMRDVAEVYAEVAEDAGQVLHLDGEAAPVMGDRELLTQSFANLIENAIRHCPPGTVITCAVDGARSGERLDRRHRPGHPRRRTRQGSAPPYRLEKSRTTEGTGLGLALVKAVADLHGADLVLGDAAPGLRVDLMFHLNAGAQ